MALHSKIAAARAFGAIAFAQGAMCVPGANADCMALLTGEPVGGAGVSIMKGWISGWTQACLAA
jgi:hypothetical protein